MNQQEKQLSEKESLDLIAQMINKAKDAHHDTGVAAIMWGAVIAICSLVRFSEKQFNYRLPFDIYLLTFLALAPQIYLNIRERKQKKVKAYDDAFMNALWFGFGISIFLLVFINNVMFQNWSNASEVITKATGEPNPFILYEYISAFFLMLYGIPTFVTGLSMKFRPMLVGGIICWVCCIISLFTPYKADLLLVAFAAIFAWFIPGIILEKDYRKARKELTAGNV
jgi:hypothetical protein